MSRRRPTAIPPSTPCLRCRRLEFKIRAVVLSVTHLPLTGSQKCWCGTIATCFRKLLDETVKTVAVFPSCLHLLGCDGNCMLSVPLSTSDLHHSRWQSGEIWQGLSTGAFTLLCHVLLTSCSSSFFFCCCLVHAFVCSMSPVFSA